MGLFHSSGGEGCTRNLASSASAFGYQLPSPPQRLLSPDEASTTSPKSLQLRYKTFTVQAPDRLLVRTFWMGTVCVLKGRIGRLKS